jgi:hypothetical protein
MAIAMSDVAADYGFTASDQESYLTEAELLFIRPGLVFEIVEFTIPEDRQPELQFKVTDPAGLPLDMDGIYTPGTMRNLFTLAYIPQGETAYVAYTTRMASNEDGSVTVEQASYDSGGVYTQLAMGEYLYKFATVLPENYDQDATTTLGVQARRDLSEWDLGVYNVNELYHYVPSGMGEAQPRDIVSTATCNRCHDPLSLHGGWRNEVGVCVLCHNPTQSTDPDTMDHVDMPYMTHKIHAGAHLENGYTIIGYRGSVHDYSHVEFPADLNDCEICHTGGVPTKDVPMVLNPNPAPTCDGDDLSMMEVAWGDEGLIKVHINAADGPLLSYSGGAGSQVTGKWVNDDTVFFMVDANTGDVIQQAYADNSVFGCANNPPSPFMGEAATDHSKWMTNPNRRACGSCHDTVDFETGENHPPQADDTRCSMCHKADTGNEYDRSVTGAHTVDYQSSQLGGFLLEVIDIRNTGPGENPTIEFAMKSKSGPIYSTDLNRLRFSISGPNTDFNYYLQEDALDGMRKSGSNWVYTFNAPLPADAMGSFSFGVEGRINATINEGQPNEFGMRDQMQNFVEPFAVTDTATMDRRVVVDDAKCESCHANLSLHGSNRHDANGYCQTCHNPLLTDARVRPEGTGAPESADFRYMIHKIHRGAELENGYVIYGHRSSLHDFSDVHYVGDLRNCDACHVDDSQMLPLPDGVGPVTTPRDMWTPMLPETASCVSCHDSDGAKIHASTHTSELGEACATCHGVGKTYSVEKVHAR